MSGSGLSGIGRSGGKRFELNDEKLFKPFYRVNYFGGFWDVTAGLVGNKLGVMEELHECAFYRPRGGSGRQRCDGVLVREQR